MDATEASPTKGKIMSNIDTQVSEFIQSAKDEIAYINREDPHHGRACAGKPLQAFVHAWDSSANAGRGGRAVTLRLKGQYLNRGSRMTFETSAEAEAFAEQVNKALSA